MPYACSNILLHANNINALNHRPRPAWRRQLVAQSAQKQLELLDLDVQKKQLDLEGHRAAQTVELEGKREAHYAAAAAIREGLCVPAGCSSATPYDGNYS